MRDLYSEAHSPQQLLAALLKPMSPDEKLARLNASIELAAKASPFYSLWPSLCALSSLDELARLPFTSKEDLRAQYPFGFLTVSHDRLARYAESTGTTGGVNAGFVTSKDWQTNNLCVALTWAGLLNSQDTLAVAVPYELSYVGADIDRVAELLGISVIAVGTNNKLCSWTRLIQLMHSHSVTALVCAPIRALRLAGLARELGFDPVKDLSVTRILCIGEALSKARKQCIERLWGANVYNHYGMTEAMAIALPCSSGYLHLAEQRFVFEIIDPNTNAVLPHGGTGELVLSTLSQEAMPLLRYRTGDLVHCISQPCSCGNLQMRIEHLGRIQDFIGSPSHQVHITELDEVLVAESGIEPIYSVVDHSTHICVNVIATDNCDWDDTNARLTEAVERICGMPVQIVAQDRDKWLQHIDNRSKPGSALATIIASQSNENLK